MANYRLGTPTTIESLIVSGTSSFTSLTANTITSTATLSIDAGSTFAMNIGQTNATSLTMGRIGADSTLKGSTLTFITDSAPTLVFSNVGGALEVRADGYRVFNADGYGATYFGNTSGPTNFNATTMVATVSTLAQLYVNGLLAYSSNGSQTALGENGNGETFIRSGSAIRIQPASGARYSSFTLVSTTMQYKAEDGYNTPGTSISFLAGNGGTANDNGGSATIDAGSPQGIGIAGDVIIGGTKAKNVLLGRSGQETFVKGFFAPFASGQVLGLSTNPWGVFWCDGPISTSSDVPLTLQSNKTNAANAENVNIVSFDARDENSYLLRLKNGAGTALSFDGYGNQIYNPFDFPRDRKIRIGEPNTTSDGYSLYIAGGTGGSTSGTKGGHLYLDAGPGNSNIDGYVYIGTVDSEAIFIGRSGKKVFFDGYATAQRDNLGTNQVSGLDAINTTAATAGQAQYSPITTWRGEQWRADLTATRTLEAGMQLQTYSANSRSGELSHYFRDNNSGSWTYHGGMGVFGTSTYFYMQNDTEGSYLQLQTDSSGTQVFSNRQLAFSAGDDTSTDPAISFAAADGSITTRFMSFFLPSISGITTEYRDLDIFPNNVSVTFNATGSPTITNQRQFYFGRRKFGGTGGTTTLTNAATVAIQDAPFADSGVTITNGYALLVESGATYLKGNLRNDGYQTQRTAPITVGGDTAVVKLTTDVTQTTDATQTTAWSLALPDTTLYWMEARVIAFGSGTQRAMYGKCALVYRDGGSATIQGSVQDVFTDVETSGGMDATFTVSGNNVRLSVTGVAATTINWAATITYQAVNNS